MGKELLFQLLTRLGLESPLGEMQNPIARLLRTDPYTPEDEPYLRQYMGIPKEGGLIPTQLRPSGVAVDDTLPWYQPSFNPVSELLQGPPLRSGRLDFLPTEVINAMKPGDIRKLWNPPAPGLGHFVASTGKGERPYLSVYDKWDFESPVISPLMQALLKRTGRGFHVYERYPLSKTKTGYKIGGDIELPSK